MPIDNEWAVEPNICGTCPIAQGVKVTVPYDIYQAWIELAREQRDEWFAYLLGDAATHTVTGFYFPEQVASGAHCAPTERAERRPGTIGTVHSHHTMGAFFSGSPESGGDRGHFNWPVEIVVAADGKCLANIRQPLACGQHHRRDTEVQLSGVPDYAANYRAELKAALESGEAEQKRLDALKPKVHHFPTAFGGFYERWVKQDAVDGDLVEALTGSVKQAKQKKNGKGNKGNTNGELLQVPLFEKGDPDLHELGTDESYWYCWNCDKTYVTLAQIDGEVKCKRCQELLLPDNDYNNAQPEEVVEMARSAKAEGQGA